MPIGEWRWTPPPPSIPQQGQVGSIAEFGPYSDFVGSTGNSAIGSHEQHPWAQMPSGPGPVQQRNAAASTGREASTAMIPTVPDWNALFSEDNEGAVGMFPGSGGNVQPLFIPHANDESYDNPLFPPYPTSTAMPVSRTTPTTSSFHAPTTATSTTAHIPTRPHHSAHQESRGQTGAADGRNIQGVNVQWDPLNVNGFTGIDTRWTHRVFPSTTPPMRVVSALGSSSQPPAQSIPVLFFAQAIRLLRHPRVNKAFAGRMLQAPMPCDRLDRYLLVEDEASVAQGRPDVK
ncbi:hypothetical protein L226DRAFT_524204 [Lentinus tigrinus ALCF2SS1-7]|uniref:uncharacterized protein n=1 Tax=Lentinus tigrinus ALCF2SS1-7 TaxID=1328758 RepID=UPI001165DF5F|nr:hypothetical protein L226DRAFT_524204 [Lentinus tigrinus ALCF2SS1-7]